MLQYTVAVTHTTSQIEIEQWASAGVSEFYFGYMPENWVRKYGWEICTNRRPYPVSPHLTDLTQVKNMVRWIHQAGAKAILAVNEHVYPEELASEIVLMAGRMAQEQADALLVSDPAILMRLRASRVNLPIYASIGLGVQNAQAVGFFSNLGIKRFVLPRKLRPDEILSLLETTPQNISYEIFLLGEWCFYNDQTCFCPHGYGKDEFCRKGQVEGQHNLSRHPLLNETYDYAWCGLCLIPALRIHEERIHFKIPVRTDVFNRSKVFTKIADIRAIANITTTDLIQMMGCDKQYCAYEFK